MTFTSLEPIFCHYAKNHDPSQPGEKDNTFLYEAYDNLPFRIKYTGWEKSSSELAEGSELLRKECKYAFQTFLTWRNSTLRYKKEIENDEIVFVEWTEERSMSKYKKELQEDLRYHQSEIKRIKKELGYTSFKNNIK